MKGLAVFVASLTLGAGVFVLGPVSTAVASPDSIAVCCAWNSELADGHLTYRISGGDSTVQGLIRTAIEKWDNAVNGLTLDETPGSPANIEVRFKKGGGVVQGLAIRHFEKIGSDSFIRGGKVTISGAFAGTPNDDTTVQIIAEQEVGHTLGIDHADFTDVMNGNLSGAVEGISTCDANAVIAANQWKLVQNLSTPEPPLVDHVAC